MSLPTLAPNRIELAPGDDIVLRFKTWQDYENLLQQRGDLVLPKIRYNAITQEIRLMSPLPRHGKSADLLADLVKLLLKHFDQDWEAFTPITLKQSQRQGIEPDYCFYVEHRTQILGKERLDLASDPPPDLVIEVDLTSLTQPQDYQAIAPVELWIYRPAQLKIYHLTPESYIELTDSRMFPGMDLLTLVPQVVERGWQTGSSIALREFEQRLSGQS
jgi:Uma2 family endonuclease